MRPLVDVNGVIRFKRNAVVRWLFEQGHFNLNRIPVDELPLEDVEEFWQMLGYSVSGYGELSFIRPETVAEADGAAEVILRNRKTP